MPDIYQELGVEPLINAAGTYTAVGGSRMSEATLRSMREAARHHVDIAALQRVVQHRIAELTQNEACCVCNSAAAGLYLTTLAAVARKHKKESRYLSTAELTNSELVSFSAQHIPYDHAVRQTGVQQVFVGYPHIESDTLLADLKNSIGDRTVALFYYLSSPYGVHTPGVLPLGTVVEVARQHNLPVVVDAAAQLPPVENLWAFTKQGVSAVIFSGGKDLKGPQASGLVVGEQDFVSLVQRVNFPCYGPGRMLKVGREEMVGLYQAVKQYVECDHQQRSQWAERVIQYFLSALSGSTFFQGERCHPNEAGQDLPYLKVVSRVAPSLVARLMKEGRPAVFIKPQGDCFYLNPMTLTADEIEPIAIKLKTVEQQLSQQS